MPLWITLVLLGGLSFAACSDDSDAPQDIANNNPVPGDAQEDQLGSQSKEFPGSCIENTDVGLDGGIDRRVLSAYNDEGDLRRREYEEDGDGVVDRWDDFSYGSSGLLSHQDTSHANPETPGRRVSFVYNAQNLQVVVNIDDARDGTIDVRQDRSYTGFGELAQIVEQDQKQDPVRTNLYTYSYNEDERPIQRALDVGNDGVVDQIIEYAYDDQGNLIQERIDHGPVDGVYDTRNYTRDASGNAIKMERDVDGNGTVDEITTYSYVCF